MSSTQEVLEGTDIWDKTTETFAKRRSGATIACLAYLVVTLARLAIQYVHDGSLTIEDDAFYYEIIARNIAQTGISTFDGQTLTNGYHPLWLALLVGKELIFGASALATIALEVLLMLGGLWFFLTSFRSSSVSIRITCALLLGIVAWPMTAKGMEVSLLVLALGWFVRTCVEVREGAAGPVALAAAAILCIGARIDSAVFVLPMLVMVLGIGRRLVPALALVGVAGAAYAAFNLWLFQVPMPISGEIKSLGGAQINTALFHQIAAYWDPAAPGMSAVHFVNSFIGRTLTVFALTVLALPFVARRTKSWPMTIGFIAGFVLFATKLVFFSSWVVWPWYAFPAVLGLVLLFHIADDHLIGRAPAHWRFLDIAALPVAGLAVAYQLGMAPPKDARGFETLNQEAVARLAPVLDGSRVAMGDRAGSFAFYYPGPLTQLEGLVNDKAYFDALKTHQDIKPLLCRRGVRFVLAYQKDLGQYDTAKVPAIRSLLTRFAGPTLTFSHADEVGRVVDLAAYDNRGTDEGDNYLYAWRLSGCDADAAAVRP